MKVLHIHIVLCACTARAAMGGCIRYLIVCYCKPSLTVRSMPACLSRDWGCGMTWELANPDFVKLAIRWYVRRATDT